MKAVGRGATGGDRDGDDGGRAARPAANGGDERPRGALGVDDWYLGYTKPGPRVYSDLFSQAKSGDYIEIVALDAGQEERGNLTCEVIGQGIDGPTNKSIRGGGHPESSSRPTRTSPPQPGPAMSKCCAGGT